MNKLEGKITGIHTEGSISLVSLRIAATSFTAIVIETPFTAAYLREGKVVSILFKETEVVIGKHADPAVSIQNKLPCIITHIDAGVLLSRLSLKSDAGELTSIITTRAVQELKIREGEHVIAMVKTNEIMLGE